MKDIIAFMIISTIIVLGFSIKKEKSEPGNSIGFIQVEINDSASKDSPPNLQTIPDGRGNFRSGQFSIFRFSQVFDQYPNIKTVIRLNGDSTHDSGGTSVADERAFWESKGVRFIRMDAHAGYSIGKGYEQSVKEVISYLQQGNVLIHCLHNFHRTGALVGAYLRSEGLSYQEVMAYNHWHLGFDKNPGKYYKYLETVWK